METLVNKNLTKNIKLYEVIGGATVPPEGNALAWRHIAEFNEARMQVICNRVQEVSDLVNSTFKVRNGNKRITFIVGSGFRPRAWELLRNRSGASRHVQSDALDVIPGNCSARLAVEIIQWLNTRYSPVVGGWNGGFAIKEPTYKGKRIIKIGFAHFDNRGVVARWTY